MKALAWPSHSWTLAISASWERAILLHHLIVQPSPARYKPNKSNRSLSLVVDQCPVKTITIKG